MMLLDTSAIIEHFIGSKEGKVVQETLKKEPCYISILTLAEAKGWCLKNGRDYGLWLEATKKLTTTVNIDEEICEKGADITFEMQKKNRDFGLMDGMILASARSINQRLMTKDRHFEGLTDAVLI
ncbi:MAG: type II toxin-antitoxin system VapC family toxin [Methanobacteriota archaeon]|nr:MAG: type II toxin-antitoxin system VapC family toxin [Euryarchaeota archaeon]